jgi:hypothetical protein
MLQVVRSRVPVPMRSFIFFFDLHTGPHYGLVVDSASNRNKYQKMFLGNKADNLTAICESIF